MKKLRWGVIGAGGIADRRTIPGMMLANNAELIAVMEINMELAEKSRAKWGCKRAYDSEAALLADPEIDAVYIASPVVLHAKQAMMAADAGKHILIEKPLAMTSEEGQKVVDYCESKGVKIAAGLMMRFGAYVMAMKQAIADGKIGRPVKGITVAGNFLKLLCDVTELGSDLWFGMPGSSCVGAPSSTRTSLPP